MQKLFPLLLCIFFITDSTIAQTKYSRVKIDLSKTSMEELSKLGLETDHGSYIPGVHFVNDFSEQELALINNAGIQNYVIVEDLKVDYLTKKNQIEKRSQNCEEVDLYEYETPINYTYGSMGGYHTYDEMIEVLADMHEKYPNLITAIDKVDGIKTWEDNDIIWLKVSDNPNVDEDEPEALYTALHHAREPNSLSQMIFYLWYLLENYETDDQVRYLVDNTEMYFMPCLNPDGYKYNELTDPEGGGFWRKNRRPDLDPERVGVDLNRNYGFFWGFDDFGSSPNMNSSVYRGPEAFSEPETQAVRAFCMQHNFQIALNYHTHGNLLIHPWAYNDLPTEEDSLFKTMGRSMTQENDFVLGTVTETVGYVANGGSDDYLYGEEADKDKIYAYTPEVGNRFWPTQSEIDQLNKSTLKHNLVTANLLLKYHDVNVRNLAPVTSERDGTFDLEIVRAGFKDGGINISLSSHDKTQMEIIPFFHIVALDQTEKYTVPIHYFISDDAPSLQEFGFDVIVGQGGYTDTIPYTFTLRETTSEEVLLDEFIDLNNWETESGLWGLTEEEFVSPPFSLTDSPGATYGNDRVDSIVFAEQISLEDSDFTTLKFSGRWEIEYNYDYVLVQVSNDGGDNWTSLCGNYTRPGRNTHGTNDPLIDGTQTDWVVEEMDLSDYSGEVINLRLMFVSDVGVQLDGFYIDDIILENDMLINTSTENTLDANALKVYPSLNNGTFDVEVESQLADGETVLEVLNIQGQLMYRGKVNSTRETLTLESISKGIYIVKLTDNTGKTLSRKINVIR